MKGYYENYIAMNKKTKFVSLADLQKASGAKPEPAEQQQGIVYSTQSGKTCPACGQPAKACDCRKSKAGRDVNHSGVIVSRETKGRKGKGVTLVSGLPLEEEALTALGKQLKQFCSSGGTIKQGRIEIQGDHRDKLLQELKRLGYSAKKSG